MVTYSVVKSYQLARQKLIRSETCHRRQTLGSYSLLGMMNYCGSRFVPDYSGLTHELQQLTKKDAEWLWNSKHENAVKTLKEALARNITLNYFDAGRKTELYCDASPVGLCAILTQIDVQGERNVVQFASRPLSSVESRYSQTEREAPGVVFGCEHFHMFLYSSPFVVVTNHKPLTYMIVRTNRNNTKAYTTPRALGVKVAAVRHHCRIQTRFSESCGLLQLTPVKRYRTIDVPQKSLKNMFSTLSTTALRKQ